ncbi:MAG: hypothetical protein ACTSYC_05850 [Promethearchaeota archaeon]
MTNHILEAYKEDIRERTNGLEHCNDRGFRVKVKEITPGIVYRDTHIKVEAFEVNHGSWPSFGFKFFTPDSVIAISGDTAPTEQLFEYYKGCDVLIHEVYSTLALKKHRLFLKYITPIYTRPPENSLELLPK